jgi:hypothetical protein
MHRPGTKTRRLVALLVVALLVGTALPATAVTGWSTRAKAATAGVSDTFASSSIGMTTAYVGRTVNKVDGVRVRVRTTDGVAAKVDVWGDAFCANGSNTSTHRTVTTKADKAWTYVTLFKPTDRKRGQCGISAGVDDFYGKKGSPLEVQIQTTSY